MIVAIIKLLLNVAFAQHSMALSQYDWYRLETNIQNILLKLQVWLECDNDF